MALPEQLLTKLLDNESFVRWVKGRANESEQEQWDSWEKADPIHRALKKRARMLYRLPIELNKGDDLEIQLGRLNARINKTDHPYVGFNPVTQYEKRNVAYRLAIAAAILLLLGVISVLSVYYPAGSKKQSITKPSYATLIVGYGEKGFIKISDGTTIQLNSSSTLRYSTSQLSTHKVEVWLKGEAYFAVTHNPKGKKREFIVHTRDGDIRDLGTRFNVNTRFNQTSVVLEKGSVKVSMKDSLRKNHVNAIMRPGERAVFSSSSAASSSQDGIALQKVDTILYTAWRHDKMIFKNTSVEKIIQIIEANYGISLKVEDPSIRHEQITGSIRNPNLKTLLRGLERILSLKIKKQNEHEFLITKRHSFK